MSLKEYKQKRSFNKTPEPRAKKTKSLPKLCFVVQKHAASHLHYDLRLEMNGVLKSWAVPKGPSLDPKDKRLAIMVEDHPYEYKDFEGTIPKGNYGAGTVVIWDKGSYEIIDNSTLKSGHLKFILHGRKLKGQFSLIKMHNSDNQWLLIKNNDTQPMPKSLRPMLAHLVNKPFNRKGWIFEIKWDGYRIMAYIQAHKTKLLSRNQKNYTKVFEPVSKELSQLDFNAILDGEMVVVDASGRAHFQLLQEYQKTGKGSLLYYVFDLLWLNGRDLTGLPLAERRKLLAQYLPKLNMVRISEAIAEKGENFFKVAAKKGLEGIMGKDMKSIYMPGQRSQSWLKIKTQFRQEVIVCGFTAPRGSRAHFGALLLGLYRNNKLEYIGHVGTGFDATSLSALKKHLHKLTQSQCPFATIPHTNMPATWVKPQLVAEVSFAEWTREGYLRQPVFLGIREDKSAPEISKETAMTDEKIISLNNHRLKLTHLTKVFWSEEQLTKSDLINYYQRIAPVILPYLKDRPQSLHRHPNGIEGDSFFHKNLENAPKWITRKKIHSTHLNQDVHYLVCQNEATLIYMAQLGCIELNPWLSRIKSLNFPDYCVIDLDPEEIGFAAVVKTAQAIHKLLDKIGADNFCKTSGATGLHIYIPLGAKYTYAQSSQFAELIASIINNQLPDITSILRSPAKRQGKVYIDYLQNRQGQTVAAPYCLRPRPQAPVSTPLQWREVTKRLDPTRFNIKTLEKRLEKYGDIWQPLLTHKGIDIQDCIRRLENFSKKI